MFSFENLQIYQKSLQLSLSIFRLSSSWPFTYKNNLQDQLIRASLSIPLNIAEGCGRSKKEFNRYLDIARGSCFECIPLLDIASNLNLINSSVKNKLYTEFIITAKMISSLKKSNKLR